MLDVPTKAVPLCSRDNSSFHEKTSEATAS